MILPSVLLFLVCLALSAYFASSETAFMAVNPFSLENLEKHGSRRAGTVRRVLARVNDFLATILIGNTLVNAAAASIATSIFASLFPGRNRAVIMATVTTTLLILLFSELTPKTYAVHNPLKTAVFAVYPIKGLMVVFHPLIRALSMLTGLLLPSLRKSTASSRGRLNEEEIRLMLRSGAGGLSTLRQRMINGALDLGVRQVKEIMVPRTEISAIPIDAPYKDVIHLVEKSRFSRYPVFRGRLDNIEGIVRAKDLIHPAAEAGGRAFDLKAIMRPPFFLPESASIEQALLQMQRRSVHLAFVADEFGSVDGLVTLEDIIEELVGDIRDEHEAPARDDVQVLSGQRYLVNGSAAVKDLNERFSLGLPEKSEYSTIAGLVISRLGRLPREKESVSVAGFRLTVEKTSKRRVLLVAVEPEAGERGKDKA